MTRFHDIKIFLDQQIDVYNNTDFIESDPICIPHSYSKLQDIEITAFWTAILAWGQRKTIILKAKQLFGMMDNSPHDFILHHSEGDLKAFMHFKHRTFQPEDTLYFIWRLKQIYSRVDSLESMFAGSGDMYQRLVRFNEGFLDDSMLLQRTRKHVSDPSRGSSCKRLNMFLRWMVRRDNKGVDFGLWKNIPMNSLMIPLDVHVFNISRQLGLLTRDKADWKAVEELTNLLREWNPQDPVQYDFALFSLGLEQRKP